jgi:hypothetical protein
MKYNNIREEELKNKVGADWFKQFDTTEILGNIDFTVFPKQDSLFGRTPLLWAEAKTGNFDITTMFVQLILTIGKARTFDKTLPPAFLGAFDFKKIAFLDYVNIQDIFYINDFNWNVTPSNHETKEFQLIKGRIESVLKSKTYVFDYQKDEALLDTFIKNNVAKATTKSKIKIDKNNFIPIYLRWVEIVKPIIDINWDELKKNNIFDSDFYLADLFVDDKGTESVDDDLSISDSLFVVFQNQGYKIAKENIKQMFDASINISNKDAYSKFWKLYKRPPIKEFQDYIVKRRDLLVPQDIRERKGAFFTPRIWVELSQKYITDYLGENWQDEYYIWDCAAGTGNLLAGLTNKYSIYASTLDQADINVMHERIEHGANLLKNHVFQFDFLNDDFTKLPQSLQAIINDPEKRKKLIIYINPPYAEAGTGLGKIHKNDITLKFNVNEKFKPIIGNAVNELFSLFMAVIYEKMPGCIIGQFSKLKFVNGRNFIKFRNFFLAEYMDGFVVPAETFDNVKGKFPIGFTIWNTSLKSRIDTITCDVYDKNGNYSGVKNFHGNLKKGINQWINKFQGGESLKIGFLDCSTPDFQNKNYVFIDNLENEKDDHRFHLYLTNNNLIYGSIYFAVRHCIEATWLNDRDQFTFPNDGWQNDNDFHNDCLIFTIFDGQNRITNNVGINYWIPFTEQQVDARNRFHSHFICDFINGKIKTNSTADLFGNKSNESAKREFSLEAKDVFDSGRKLWKYYHSKPNVNVNASLYDIREYFQGRNEKGKMKSKSDDPNYMELIGELRYKLDFLADKIKPKIYEYGFLKA